MTDYTPDTDSDVTVQDLIDRLHGEADREFSAANTPDVGIIMGSDSDLDTMSGAHDAFEELGFEEQTDFQDPPAARFTYETYVVSAHRTPELMYAYGETAAERGLDVVIAGAGGKSADLPNMTASIAYPIPVIGMPTGAPIVAVDAGKSFNAALSAVQILGREHVELQDRLNEYHDALVSDVARDSRDLHDLGVAGYRESRGADGG